MADEIIKVLEYILSSPELRVLVGIYLLFFSIVFILVIVVFGIVIK